MLNRMRVFGRLEGVAALHRQLLETRRLMKSAMLLGCASFCMSGVFAQGSNDTSLPSIPDFFQQKGLPRAQGVEAQSANELINTFTGKLQYHFTDLLIPGNGGMDLAIRRSYNSIDDPLATPASWASYEYSPIGLGWTMHMGRVIRGANKAICSASWSSASANPVLELPDGSRQILYEYYEAGASTPTWLTKDFWRAKCHSGFLHVQSPDGTTYEMTAMGHSFGEPGSLQRTFYAGRIVDRNGNWFNLSYSFLPIGVYALSQITTSDGRSVSFAYSGSTLASITDTLSNRVWQYTVGAGLAGHVQLNRVQRPDGLSWKYAYRTGTPGTGSMSRVEYPSGASIDYVYSHVDFRAGTTRSGNSTVVSSKTASTNTPDGKSGTWSWTYEVATDELPYTVNGSQYTYTYGVPPDVRSQVNVTTVTDPLGKATEHFHLGVHSVRVVPTDVGLLMGSVSESENTLFGYTSVPISEQQDVVANYFSNSYFYPAAAIASDQYRFRPGETFVVSKSGYDEWGNPSFIDETGTNNDRTYTRQTELTYNVNTSKWLLRQVSNALVTVGAQTHATTRQFDINGNLQSQSVAGVPTSFTYHGTGDVHTTTNAKGQVTTYNSYLRGIPRSESQPEGVAISRNVDAAGNVTSITNGRGKTTTYTYDGLNRPTSITKPVGSPVAITWGATTRQVQRGGMTDKATFDGLGRQLRREVSAAGETPIWVDFSYDMLGRRLYQSYPNSAKGTGFRYDTLGRVVQTLHGNPVGTNSANVIEETFYDSLQVLRYDTTNRASLVWFRAFGNPQEQHAVRSLAGEISAQGMYVDYDVTMTRDLLGQMTTATMGDKARTYGYDSRYYLVSRADPETGTTVFGRDALGNLTSKSIGTQPATTYAYDGRNRLTGITYPSSEQPGVPNASNVTRTYNGNDLVTGISSGGVVRGFEYDDGDNLIAEELAMGGATQQVSYTYNSSEALASITYPSGHQVQYSPDAFGRARAVLPYVNQVRYHPNGMPSELHYANGVVSTMGVNDRQWPAGLKMTRAGSSFIDSTYAYDPVGNLTGINDSADSAYSRYFEYDKLNRLTLDNDVGGYREYFYDGVGNITHVAQPGSLRTYSYAATSGLLTGVSGGGLSRAYQYDSAGNVKDDGVWTFGHDRANNLRCIACAATVPTAHTYDGDNTRVQTSDATGTTQYLHGQQGLLLQTLVPGVERKEHIYLGRRQVAQRRVVD